MITSPHRLVLFTSTRRSSSSLVVFPHVPLLATSFRCFGAPPASSHGAKFQNFNGSGRSGESNRRAGGGGGAGVATTSGGFGGFPQRQFSSPPHQHEQQQQQQRGLLTSNTTNAVLNKISKLCQARGAHSNKTPLRMIAAQLSSTDHEILNHAGPGLLPFLRRRGAELELYTVQDAAGVWYVELPLKVDFGGVNGQRVRSSDSGQVVDEGSAYYPGLDDTLSYSSSSSSSSSYQSAAEAAERTAAEQRERQNKFAFRKLRPFLPSGYFIPVLTLAASLSPALKAEFDVVASSSASSMAFPAKLFAALSQMSLQQVEVRVLGDEPGDVFVRSVCETVEYDDELDVGDQLHSRFDVAALAGTLYETILKKGNQIANNSNSNNNNNNEASAASNGDDDNDMSGSTTTSTTTSTQHHQKISVLDLPKLLSPDLLFRIPYKGYHYILMFERMPHLFIVDEDKYTVEARNLSDDSTSNTKILSSFLVHNSPCPTELRYVVAKLQQPTPLPIVERELPREIRNRIRCFFSSFKDFIIVHSAYLFIEENKKGGGANSGSSSSSSSSFENTSATVSSFRLTQMSREQAALVDEEDVNDNDDHDHDRFSKRRGPYGKNKKNDVWEEEQQQEQEQEAAEDEEGSSSDDNNNNNNNNNNNSSTSSEQPPPAPAPKSDVWDAPDEHIAAEVQRIRAAGTTPDPMLLRRLAAQIAAHLPDGCGISVPRLRRKLPPHLNAVVYKRHPRNFFDLFPHLFFTFSLYAAPSTVFVQRSFMPPPVNAVPRLRTEADLLRVTAVYTMVPKRLDVVYSRLPSEGREMVDSMGGYLTLLQKYKMFFAFYKDQYSGEVGCQYVGHLSEEKKADIRRRLR